MSATKIRSYRRDARRLVSAIGRTAPAHEDPPGDRDDRGWPDPAGMVASTPQPSSLAAQGRRRAAAGPRSDIAASGQE